MNATADPTRGPRARAKEETRAHILASARRHLAEEGPSGLRFRAVARDVGLVSSAVYRYFPSRDALLTELIIESYDGLSDAATQAEAAVPRDCYGDRYRAVGRAMQRWAFAEPQQWALIFGSPVPGYDAPQDTVRAATRIPLLLATIISDAFDAGTVTSSSEDVEELHDLLLLRSVFHQEIPDDVLVRGLVAWTYLLGSVSAQLFGQRHRVITDDGFVRVFEAELDQMVALLGFHCPDRA